MTTELAYLAQQWLAFSLMLALQLGLILLLRKPVRTWLGAAACYRLWLLPLLWLPFYVFGPALLSLLAKLTSAGAAGEQTSGALQQFMQLELLPFTLDASGVALASSGSLARYGWTTLALVWAAGTIALVVWHGRRWLDFSRQVRKLGAPLSAAEQQDTGVAAHFDAQIPVLCLQGMSSAALFGVVRPALLLPRDFSWRYDSNQRHIILAHEAVHLRRRDNCWNLCALLLLALFWTNPLVLLAWRYLRLDQELSCDALALGACTHEQQKRYARTLLDSLGTQTATTPRPALSAWDNLRDLKERSLMIKHHLVTASNPARTLFSLMLLALFGASLTISFAELVSSAAVAAEQEQATPSEQQNRPVSQSVGSNLSEAIRLLNGDKFAEARATLQPTLQLLQEGELTAFEASRVHQLMFNLEMVDENYPAAREQLQLSIESGGLNEQEVSTMRYRQTQLYMQEEKYAEAATALEAWIAFEVPPKPAAHYLLAMAYFYQEMFDSALPHAQQAVDLAGDEAQKGWLAILASLHVQREDYEAAEAVTARLVKLFPDSDAHRRQLEELKLQNAKP
ncbi:MAG: hypothetical protein RLZZ227_2567 [Pseudomonadota bacterium]|jgi:beta-lactamase regulating signal transducer with metallopeptidase domain